MSTYVARIDIAFYRQTQPYGERKRQAIPTDTAMSSGGDGDGASNDVQIRWSEGAHEDKLARYHRIGIIVFVTMILCFVFVAILFLLLHFYFKYVQRRQPRHRRAAVHTGIASEVRWTQTPEPVVIATLPSFPYRTAAANRPDGSPQPLECVVCLSTVEEGEMVKVMPNCKHTFHEGCIDMWLHSQTTCPICRTEAAPATTTVNGDHEVEAREASVAVETPEICGTARLERRGSDRDVRESSTASAGRLGASLRPILMTDTSSRTQNEGNEDLERR